MKNFNQNATLSRGEYNSSPYYFNSGAKNKSLPTFKTHVSKQNCFMVYHEGQYIISDERHYHIEKELVGCSTSHCRETNYFQVYILSLSA
jgi:hypothetical protein